MMDGQCRQVVIYNCQHFVSVGSTQDDSSSQGYVFYHEKMKRQERTSTPVKAVTAFHMKESKSETRDSVPTTRGHWCQSQRPHPLGRRI